MGAISSIDCECGFMKDDVFIGVGMAGVGSTLVSCATCGDLHTIITSNAFGDESEPVTVRTEADGCPECGGVVVEVTSSGGPCPQCGGVLRISRTGLWD